MKEESVLNVLMYLFENHMKDSCKLTTSSDELFEQLEEAGFQSTAIDQAMDWLEKLIGNNRTLLHAPQATSTRVLTPYEKEFVDLECESFIRSLEQQKVLSPETREIVINQILALGSNAIDLSLIKWVTLMVLFNRSDNSDNALARMEFLVLDNTMGEVH